MATRFPIRALFLPAIAIAFLSAIHALPAQKPDAIPVENEPHHHVVLENSYVRVLFVEIPPHETTLSHHHDLPYVSVPPGGADAVPPRPGAATPDVPHVGYSAGNLTHAVTNSSDSPQRNVAVELVRPQGVVRNRCAAILPNQPADICQDSSLFAINGSKPTPLLESDEILVESLELGPGAALKLKTDHVPMLVVDLTDVTVAGPPGIDSAHVIRGGLLWIPAGSNPVFKTAPDRGGHFVTIIFKDSAPVAN